jgi:GTP cyclohydrolase IA
MSAAHLGSAARRISQRDISSDTFSDLAEERQRALAETVRRQLELMGEDVERNGLERTPGRVAASLTWLTRGYGMTAEDAVGEGVFEDPHRNMVLVRDVSLFSLCEHHMLPMIGKAHVAYIPDGRILGLSKIPRLVDVFARRLQVQERLTDDVANALQEVLQPAGVGVVIEAQHMCMMMRGVERQGSSTITSAVRGVFQTDPATRDEFFRLIHGRS